MRTAQVGEGGDDLLDPTVEWFLAKHDGPLHVITVGVEPRDGQRTSPCLAIAFILNNFGKTPSLSALRRGRGPEGPTRNRRSVGRSGDLRPQSDPRPYRSAPTPGWSRRLLWRIERRGGSPAEPNEAGPMSATTPEPVPSEPAASRRISRALRPGPVRPCLRRLRIPARDGAAFRRRVGVHPPSRTSPTSSSKGAATTPRGSTARRSTCSRWPKVSRRGRGTESRGIPGPPPPRRPRRRGMRTRSSGSAGPACSTAARVPMVVLGAIGCATIYAIGAGGPSAALGGLSRQLHADGQPALLAPRASGDVPDIPARVVRARRPGHRPLGLVAVALGPRRLASGDGDGRRGGDLRRAVGARQARTARSPGWSSGLGGSWVGRRPVVDPVKDQARARDLIAAGIVAFRDIRRGSTRS